MFLISSESLYVSSECLPFLSDSSLFHVISEFTAGLVLFLLNLFIFYWGLPFSVIVFYDKSLHMSSESLLVSQGLLLFLRVYCFSAIFLMILLNAFPVLKVFGFCI